MAKALLARVCQAMQAYSRDTGASPTPGQELKTLREGGYLDDEELVDPWGYPLGYHDFELAVGDPERKGAIRLHCEPK